MDCQTKTQILSMSAPLLCHWWFWS